LPERKIGREVPPGRVLGLVVFGCVVVLVGNGLVVLPGVVVPPPAPIPVPPPIGVVVPPLWASIVSVAKRNAPATAIAMPQEDDLFMEFPALFQSIAPIEV
jgi:hypothetical protein